MRIAFFVAAALVMLWAVYLLWRVASPASANALPAPSASDVKTTSPDEIRQSYLKHAALTQFYRWFQAYENDRSSLDNALEILDPDVHVKSGLGESRGRDAYRDRFANLPKNWRNAHDVKSVDITINADGTISLLANVRYLNRGLLPSGGVRAADLIYRTLLRRSDALLPKFLDIEIAQNSESTVADFVPTYGANRVKSLIHYWLALVESPKHDPEAFREILADNFVLNFSSGKVDTFEKFKAWYAGPASSLSAAEHTILSFTQEEIAPQTYRAIVDFDWQGIRPDGAHLVGRTQHEWIVTDNPADRFARIKSDTVTMLVPFQPKP